MDRRKFLKKGVATVIGVSATGFAGLSSAARADLKDELGDTVTSYSAITSYNNFYEFSTNKTEVKELSADFKTYPWSIKVDGLVKNPGIFDLDDIRRGFDKVERVYRMRCVEAWSMVIPWEGIALSELLKKVEPTSDARYVRFVSLYDKNRMPGQKSGSFPWPYVEGLTMDEARHPLTLLATGIDGKPLKPQNGAPVRLVVPWKYGFKSIKSIVKIELVKEKPQSLWMQSGPSEYGFYANVNPNVSHPRWSQASERRIGDFLRRKTLMFNGYGKQVSSLYKGLDLKRNF